MDFGKKKKNRCGKGKFEKNGYGVENLKKRKKITCGVIHGVHISLFGGEGLFLPPPMLHIKT